MGRYTCSWCMLACFTVQFRFPLLIRHKVRFITSTNLSLVITAFSNGDHIIGWCCSVGSYWAGTSIKFTFQRAIQELSSFVLLVRVGSLLWHKRCSIKICLEPLALIVLSLWEAVLLVKIVMTTFLLPGHFLLLMHFAFVLATLNQL